MGTKLQCKSYLPGYYSMRDLNEDANTGSWSLFFDEKMLKSEQYYNVFTPRPVDGYSECDKEVLKQTMLDHEATFRKQVYELHRLYRIQRDLMDELQKKELYSYSISAETSSQSNLFSSRVPSEYMHKMWQMPSLPVVNSSYCGTSISGTDNRRSSLDFLKESSMQAGVRGSVKDCEVSDSKCKKFPRKTFDLQLPADEYIDSEDGEATEEEKVREMSLGAKHCLDRHCGSGPRSGESLSLGAGQNPSCGANDWKLESHVRNSCRSRCLADLNEPIRGICSEEAEALASSNFQVPMAFHEEIQGRQLHTEPKASVPVLQRDSFLDNQKGGDHRTHLSILHPEDGEKRREQLSYPHEAGKIRDDTNSRTPFFCQEKLPMSSEPTQAEVKKVHELPPFLLSDWSSGESWFREKATSGTDISKASPGLTIPNYSGQVVAPVLGSFSATPASGTNMTSSSVSSWRNPANNITHSPVAIQVLPCFNGSAVSNMRNMSSSPSIQSPGAAGEKWDLHSKSRSHLSSGSYQNGCNHLFESEPNALHLQFIGFNTPKPQNGNNSPHEHIDASGPGKFLKGWNCTDVKSAKDMNLNIHLPNEFQGEEKPPHGPVVNIAVEGKHGVLSGIPWLRKKPTCNESASITGSTTQLDLGFSSCIQPVSTQDAETWQFESGTGTEKDPLGFLQEAASTLLSKDAVTHKIELGDGPSYNKLLSFPLFDKTHILRGQCAFSSASMLCQGQSEIYDTEKNVKICSPRGDSPHGHTPLDLEKQQPFVEDLVAEMVVEKSPTSLRRCINLNSTVSAWDEQAQSQEILLKTDAEYPTSSSVPRAAVEMMAGIDLESPIVSQAEDAPPQGESPGTNQPETPVQPLRCEMEDPQGALARLAAEVIVDLSSAMDGHSGDDNCSPSSLRDSLLWFSEVVSSNAGDLENAVRVSRGKADGDNEFSDIGSDSFEAMTLKLSETMVDVEYCYKPWERENQKDEEMGPAPLPTRPRRRQARRGRQRNDFQKDILPGLVSLSRHEVTEDLQMIGGLMRASGCSWPIGLARRNTGRNGWHCQARGRRRPRGSSVAAAVTANLVGPPPRQPSNSEVEVDGISLRGWGKTTRRCQRQRFRTGNFSAPLT
ncbi:uncharacterized protein LOC131229416 [Magnolia sinica]|uniref:uncharacterized protein LOC131229416 n=1 Tax=Magnolia sinica TaxID=86752 RepID=UPI00265996D3|nr:uncharacterized protein LOC131229416 [Magnolia sinica]